MTSVVTPIDLGSLSIFGKSVAIGIIAVKSAKALSGLKGYTEFVHGIGLFGHGIHRN